MTGTLSRAVDQTASSCEKLTEDIQACGHGCRSLACCRCQDENDPQRDKTRSNIDVTQVKRFIMNGWSGVKQNCVANVTNLGTANLCVLKLCTKDFSWGSCWWRGQTQIQMQQGPIILKLQMVLCWGIISIFWKIYQLNCNWHIAQVFWNWWTCDDRFHLQSKLHLHMDTSWTIMPEFFQLNELLCKINQNECFEVLCETQHTGWHQQLKMV